MNQKEREKMIEELRMQKKEIKKQLHEIERLQLSVLCTPKEFRKYEARKHRLKGLIQNLDEQIKALKTDNLFTPVGKGKIRLRTGRTEP